MPVQLRKELTFFKIKTLLASTLVLCLFAEAAAVTPLQPEPEHSGIQQKVVGYLSSRHYNKLVVDDQLSSRLLDSYLDLMDPSRSYFLAADIAEFESYRNTLDDRLKKGQLDAAYQMYNRLRQRQEDRFTWLLDKVSQGAVQNFDFTQDEYFELNREDADWLADMAASDYFWNKRLKATVLAMLLDEEAREEIEETLSKRYSSRLKRITQVSSEDVFQVYMNALAKLYDPHTEYFSPRISKNFNINMSLSLEGIGALLRMEDEETTVVRLVPAGPAEKAGELRPNDKILAVGQGPEGEMVNIVGWRLDDVVELIRGPKGTIVRLKIRSGNDTDSRIIRITRNTVKLEDQAAKSGVMEVARKDKSHSIGVIKIPIFYADFKGMREGVPNYRSTTRDVRKLLEEFNSAELSGLIIDLRGNGGGSLQEANSLIGLFIPSGPTVQVRHTNNKVNVFSNTDRKAVYEGPLVVLINRLSASASEIFSAAIQDYGRGLIVGTRSYGKGTVQMLAPLNNRQLKITQAKFYRISGESTQHFGVTPDIRLTQIYDPEDIGESALDNALPGGSIRSARYREYRHLRPLVETLRERHQARAETNPELVFLENNFLWNKERKAKTRISLNREKREIEKEKSTQHQIVQENIKRTHHCLAEISSLDEIQDSKIRQETLPDCVVTEDFARTSWMTRPHTIEDSAKEAEAVPADATEANSMEASSETVAAAAGVSEAEEVEELTDNVAIEDPLLAETGRILADLIDLAKTSLGISSRQ